MWKKSIYRLALEDISTKPAPQEDNKKKQAEGDEYLYKKIKFPEELKAKKLPSTSQGKSSVSGTYTLPSGEKRFVQLIPDSHHIKSPGSRNIANRLTIDKLKDIVGLEGLDTRVIKYNKDDENPSNSYKVIHSKFLEDNIPLGLHKEINTKQRKDETEEQHSSREIGLLRNFLKTQDTDKLQKIALLHYLTNAGDRHFNNYVVDRRGQLHPIDHGYSFHADSKKEKSIVWDRMDPIKDLFIGNKDNYKQPINKDILKKIVDNTHNIKRTLRHFLLSSYSPKGRKKIEDMTEDRLRKIKKLHSLENPTFEDLHKVLEHRFIPSSKTKLVMPQETIKYAV